MLALTRYDSLVDHLGNQAADHGTGAGDHFGECFMGELRGAEGYRVSL